MNGKDQLRTCKHACEDSKILIDVFKSVNDGKEKNCYISINSQNHQGVMNGGHFIVYFGIWLMNTISFQ